MISVVTVKILQWVLSQWKGLFNYSHLISYRRKMAVKILRRLRWLSLISKNFIPRSILKNWLKILDKNVEMINRCNKRLFIQKKLLKLKLELKI